MHILDYYHGLGVSKLLLKGVPARKSRTWPRLVSLATGREKKILYPSVLVKNWVLENISSIVTRIHVAKIISHII